VPEGSWTLRVRSPGRAPIVYPVVISKASPPETIALAIESGTTVRGTVRAPDDVDLVQATLLFVDENGKDGPHAKLARDGSYSATGFAPGVYRPLVFFEDRLRGWPPLFPTTLPSVEIAPHMAEVPCDLALEHGGFLDIMVSDAALPPPPQQGGSTAAQRAVAAATLLEVRDAAHRLIHRGLGLEAIPGSVSWANYELALPLAPGTYEVRLELPGHAPAVRTATVETDQFASVRLP
jgi:hypothetical protein